MLEKVMSSAAFARLHHGALSVAYGLSIFAVLISILFSWAFNREAADRRRLASANPDAELVGVSSQVGRIFVDAKSSSSLELLTPIAT
jgi:hypothetical protein